MHSPYRNSSPSASQHPPITMGPSQMWPPNMNLNFPQSFGADTNQTTMQRTLHHVGSDASKSFQINNAGTRFQQASSQYSPPNIPPISQFPPPPPPILDSGSSTNQCRPTFSSQDSPHNIPPISQFPPPPPPILDSGSSTNQYRPTFSSQDSGATGLQHCMNRNTTNDSNQYLHNWCSPPTTTTTTTMLDVKFPLGTNSQSQICPNSQSISPNFSFSKPPPTFTSGFCLSTPPECNFRVKIEYPIVQQRMSSSFATNIHQLKPVMQQPNTHQPQSLVQQPNIHQPQSLVQQPNVHQPQSLVQQPNVHQSQSLVQQPNVYQPQSLVHQSNVYQPQSLMQQPNVYQPQSVVQQPNVYQPQSVVQQPNVHQPQYVVQQPNVQQPQSIVQQPNIHQPQSVVQQPNVYQPQSVVQQPNVHQLQSVVQQPNVHQPQSVVQQPNVHQLQPVVQHPNVHQPQPVVQQPNAYQPQTNQNAIAGINQVQTVPQTLLKPQNLFFTVPPIQNSNMYPLMPPPYHTPVIVGGLQSKLVKQETIEHEEKVVDDIIVKNFLAKTRLKDFTSKNDGSTCITIPDFQFLLKAALSLLEKLATERNNLMGLVNVDNEVWNEKLNYVNQLKEEFSEIHCKLLNNRNFSRILVKLKKTAKKRKKNLERKERYNCFKRQKQQNRLLLHQELDSWLETLREKDLQKKKEAEMKKEADSILSEVRRKIQEAKKTMEKLKIFEKLRQARKEHAQEKGMFVHFKSDLNFKKGVSEMKELMLKQLSDYEAEEKALQVMLETEQEGQLEAEAQWKLKQLRKHQEKKCNNILESLFGQSEPPQPNSPQYFFWQQYNAGNCDINSLIKIRLDWDMYLVSRDSEKGSSIPQRWVVPEAPSSDAWSFALKDNPKGK